MKIPEQPRVPHNVNKGDRIKFWLHPDDALRYGTVIDILSTQFLIEDDDNHTHIVHFRNVSPLVHAVVP